MKPKLRQGLRLVQLQQLKHKRLHSRKAWRAHASMPNSLVRLGQQSMSPIKSEQVYGILSAYTIEDNRF